MKIIIKHEGVEFSNKINKLPRRMEFIELTKSLFRNKFEYFKNRLAFKNFQLFIQKGEEIVPNSLPPPPFSPTLIPVSPSFPSSLSSFHLHFIYREGGGKIDCRRKRRKGKWRFCDNE